DGAERGPKRQARHTLRRGHAHVERNRRGLREMPATCLCNESDVLSRASALAAQDGVVPPEAVMPLHLADVIYPARHPLAGQAGVVLGFAVRSGDDVVLVDTGVGFGNTWVDDN